MLLEDDNLYYVGGVVRDEILGVKSVDFDYTYQGDAINFAQNAGLNIIKINPEFHTVRVLIGNKEIDIASTREESYPKKGHLPKVFNIACSIEKDLRRRDFTINAIAKRTTDNEIIDVFNGVKDIKNKTLRVLHKDSFVDDPTRIIRGLKFSVRFGFELETETLRLQDEYLNNIDYDMSYHRLKSELKDAFNLNKHEVLDKFISQNIYKLLGKEDFLNINSLLTEESLKDYKGLYTWLIYLSSFSLANFNLTKAEKRILEYTEKIDKEGITKNTPLESIIINKLRNNYV